MTNQIVVGATMGDFRVLGKHKKVWDDVVKSFDKRIPISEAGAGVWFKRALEEEKTEDKVYCLFMYVMFQIQLDGVAPYSDDALTWLRQGLISQIGVMKIEHGYPEIVQQMIDEENSIEERICRGILDSGDVNADKFVWGDE